MQMFWQLKKIEEKKLEWQIKCRVQRAREQNELTERKFLIITVNVLLFRIVVHKFMIPLYYVFIC